MSKDTATLDAAAIDAACLRHLRDFLRSQVRELENIGMGDIVYAVHAQRCLTRIDASLAETAPVGTRRVDAPPALRLVE